MITIPHPGQWIAGQPSQEGSTCFSSENPRTGVLAGTRFVNASSGEIDRAAREAARAFEVLRAWPASRLASLLEEIGCELEALGDELLSTCDEETGLGAQRLTGERGRTTGQLSRFAALLREGSYVEAIIDTARPERQPVPRADLRRMLVPIGPVAVFTAGNFPLAFGVAGGDTASALAAGCPVIVKAHPGYPRTSELTARAIMRALADCGAPAGAFSLLHGDTPDIGRALVTHPAIAAVGFTGSHRAGRAIFDAAASRPTPIPVYAEMGSVNPVVILPGAVAARAEALAQALAASVTLGTGQFCTNPGLVFVVGDASGERLVDMVVDRMRAAQPAVLLNRRVQQGLVEAVQGTLARPRVTALTGAAPLDGPACGYAHTVLQADSAAFRADPALQREHFGPVTLLVTCESLEDLLTTLAALEGNLTASVLGEPHEFDDARRAFAILREKAGRLIWNGFPTGVEVVSAMHHGGPYPATTAPATTSVGTMAIKRFLRPVTFQDLPEPLLPDALKDSNPLGIWRRVDDRWTKEAVP